MTPDQDIILPTPWHGRRSWIDRIWRSNTLTIVVSVGLHAALFVAFYRVVFSTQEAPKRVIIPEARLAPGGGSADRATSGELPKLSPRPPAPPPGGARPTEVSGAAGGSPLQLSEMPVVAVNLGGGSNFVVGSSEGTSANRGTGSSQGSLLGGGYGSGTGGTTGSMVGPATSFFGAAGNAYRIVYVVDVSNSLMYYRKDIIREVRDSIRNLTPTQEFGIILAKPKQIQEFNGQRLVLANARNKSDATAFIEGTALARDVGEVDPVGALDRAFSLQPELVYFLSDGEYDNIKDDLLKKVADLHKRFAAKITVISIEPSPRNLPVLERIARETGGYFRPVQLDK